MNRLKLYLLFIAVLAPLGLAFSGANLFAAGFGEPSRLPLAWSATVDSTSCKEPNRLQAFLDKASTQSDHTVQERMLVSVAYAQGRQLFTVLVDIIDVFDREVISWSVKRDHPLWYRFKQAPWQWFNKPQSAEHEIEGYLTALKQRRAFFAQHLGELNTVMHALRDACEPDSDNDLIKNLKQLVDVEHAILTPVGHEALSSSADLSAISARIIENMGKSVHYKNAALGSMKELNIPGHMARNCTVYATTAVVLAAAGLYLYCNRAKLPILKQQINNQAARIWKDHLKNKFDAIKNIFWSDKKDNENLEKFKLEIGQRAQANAVALEKAAIDSVMSAGLAPNEQEARKMVTKAHAENTLAILFDQCKTACGNKWVQNAVITKYIDKLVTIGSALAYDKLDPALRIIELGIGEFIDIKKQHELTSAFLAVTPFVAGAYIAYRWLNSQEQWSKNMRNELIRARTLLDHSSSDAMTESERQGMIIYALHHLQKEAHGVPMADKKRFEADLLFLQRSDISDEYKVQRIDSFLGPYRFLKA